MNKKRFIILTVILVLSLAVNVTVYAFNSDSSVQNIDEVAIIKQTKPNDKIFFTLNSEKAELSYKGKISSLQTNMLMQTVTSTFLMKKTGAWDIITKTRAQRPSHLRFRKNHWMQQCRKVKQRI